MIALRNIVVPTDFSPGAAHALKHAAALAADFRAKMHLMHVVEFPEGITKLKETISIREKIEKGMKNGAEEELKQIEESLRKQGVDVVAHVRYGKPFYEIIKYARETEGDLIVLATHGRRGFQKEIFGSTVERVVRKAPCPVMSIRGEDVAAEGPMHRPYKKVLWPADFSGFSEHALKYALAICRQYGAQLYVFHSVENMAALSYGSFTAAIAAEVQQEMITSAEFTLDKLVPEADRKGIETKMIVKVGNPADQIIGTARQENIDLITMSTHGRSGITSVLIGSVAERVVRLAPCPVLTMRHPEHEFVMP